MNGLQSFQKQDTPREPTLTERFGEYNDRLEKVQDALSRIFDQLCGPRPQEVAKSSPTNGSVSAHLDTLYRLVNNIESEVSAIQSRLSP